MAPSQNTALVSACAPKGGGEVGLKVGGVGVGKASGVGNVGKVGGGQTCLIEIDHGNGEPDS